MNEQNIMMKPAMVKTSLVSVVLYFALGVLFSFPVYAENSMAEELIPVTVKSLQQIVFHPVKKAPAQVVSLQNSLLSAEVSALVVDVHIEIGDQVVKDQLLISLECDDYEFNKQQLLSEKNALEAERRFASYQFERSKKLLKSKSVSQEAHRRQATEVTRLTAQIQLLLSKVQQAEKTISRCQIKAPFTGVIAERLIHIGEHVAPHTPLIRLINVDELEVEVQVPIVVIDDLDYASLKFVYRNKDYPLTLRAILPSIETRARHQRVRLNFVDKKALADAYGIVEISLRAMSIPANYLLSRNSQVGVFLLKESTDKHFQAQFFAIKGALTGRAAVIDLPLDTKVIISGRNALTNGQRVILK